jgi:nucleoside 2-deoxyribosyltransferase
MTNIYLASSFANVNLVEFAAKYLTERGHHITTEWWHTDFKQAIQKPDVEWYKDEKVQFISKRNFKGITDADVLVLIGHPREPRKYNGANIELGFALALGKQCYSIGCLERSAMYCSVKQLEGIEELVFILSEKYGENKQ